MRRKAVAGLVVLLGRVVIVEHPATVLLAARLVHQATDLVLLALPEAPHAAVLPIAPPQLRIDVSGRIERCHELVAVARRAAREFLRAREVETDASELVRQLRHVRLPPGCDPAESSA